MKAAFRYAKSLLQLAVERKELDAIVADMALIASTAEASRELVLFLKSPVIAKSHKKEALAGIFDGKISETTRAFMDILVRKGREDSLLAVTKAFEKLYHEYAGIVDVEVTTASELDPVQEQQLVASLQTKTGKKVVVSKKIDPAVRGGVKARIGDTVIDGTVQHKLEQLRNTLHAKG